MLDKLASIQEAWEPLKQFSSATYLTVIFLTQFHCHPRQNPPEHFKILLGVYYNDKKQHKKL